MAKPQTIIRKSQGFNIIFTLYWENLLEKGDNLPFLFFYKKSLDNLGAPRANAAAGISSIPQPQQFVKTFFEKKLFIYFSQNA
jgi:hypothetical protein